MPRSTVEHEFEEMVMKFASDFSTLRSSEPEAFAIAFNDSGVPVVTKFASELPSGNEVTRVLMGEFSEHERVFFFDPFDWPEYAWVQWRGVCREMMERLTGQTFDESSLPRAKAGDDAFPSTWSFMY